MTGAGRVGLALAVASLLARPSVTQWSPVAASALVSVTAAGAHQEQRAVEREWRVRRWALFPERARAELAAALAAAAWAERAAGLDAILRGLEAGGEVSASLLARAAMLLADPHPNVRARALDVRRAACLPVTTEQARRLAADVLPLVRLALVRALEVGPAPGGSAGAGDVAPALATLAADDDPRVAAAARVALCAHASVSVDVTRELLVVVDELMARAADDELLDLAIALERSHPRPELLQSLTQRFSGRSMAERGWRAVFEAVALAVHGEGDVDRLIDGWIATASPDPRRRTLLLRAARGGATALERRERAWTFLQAATVPVRLLGGPAFAAGLAPLSERWPGLVADWTRTSRGSSLRFPVQRDFVEAAFVCVAPEVVLELALVDRTAMPFHILGPELGGRIDHWPAASGEALLAVDGPMAVGAFALTLSRTADATAERLLVRALSHADEAVVARAFRALSSSDVAARQSSALHTAWRQLPPAEALTRLSWLPRRHALLEFRQDLLALGVHLDTRRRVACEMLAPFTGDAEVGAAIEAWLRADMALFERLAEARHEAARRAVELRIQGELRALAGVHGGAGMDGEVDPIDAVLLRSHGRSTEIGKLAAALLSHSPAGRARLAARLGTELDRRTRIEVAIGLAPFATGDSLAAVSARLVEDYPAAGWDLRVRMLAALGRTADAHALAFLRTIAGAPEVELEQRHAALGALATRADAPAVAALTDIALTATDVDTRRSAIHGLGQVGTEAAARALARILAATLADVPVSGFGAEQRLLLRGEALSALGASGSFPAELEVEWLREPVRSCGATLRRRLAGEPLASVEFTWRGELELAGHLAAAGRLDAVLDAAGAWWRLDARLLLSIAAEALRAGDTAVGERLLRAAVIGLAGEPNAASHERSDARLGLLSLAFSTERWEAAERLLATILADRRAGRFSNSVWVQRLGTFDRARATDPHGRLTSALFQARAWRALAEGRTAEAARWARRAADRVGESRRARTAQQALTAAAAH